MQESYTTANERIKSLRQQLEITQHKLEVAESQLELSRGESATQGMKYAEISERLVETERKVKEGEMLRRKLHNTILVRHLLA